MNRLKRTFSLRRPKKKSEPNDSSTPPEWLEDEIKVRGCCCTFQVKYLGCVEVFESKGMKVCEEAIEALRKSNKKPHKAILHISGDSLRVSDELSQHLIVDQAIEKVSFCAPDTAGGKGFAYICRDGATRRWMCHAFIAIKNSGQRLSHAVGCAFHICLEQKQKRADDALKLSCSTASDDRGFFRIGSCRPQLPSVAQRLIDPQSAVVAKAPPSVSSPGAPSSIALATTGARVNGGGGCSDLPAAAAALSTGTVARPRPNLSVYERQASLRIFPKLQDASPFKRELSLRLERLPSGPQRGMGATKSGDDCIIDEESPEEQLQPPLPPSSSVFSTASPATSQQTGPALGTGRHSTSLEWELSALAFPDPFSSAPVNPATIQQHLQQQHHQQQQQQQLNSGQPTGRNHLNWWGGSALSAPAPPQPPNTGALTVVSSQTTAAAEGQQYGAVQGLPPFVDGGPPVATASTPMPSSLSSPVPSSVSRWGSSSIATVNGNPPHSSWLSSGGSNAIYAQSGMSTGSPLALPVASTGVSLGHMSPAPPLASTAARQQPVWPSAMPAAAADTNYPLSTPSSAWLSSMLLLPPEPDRYSDPFDLGWVERATAVFNQSMRSRPGNPFVESLSATTSAAQPVVPFPLPANGHPVSAAPLPGQPRPVA